MKSISTNNPELTHAVAKGSSFSSKTGSNARTPMLTLSFNIVLEVLASTVRKEKEIKDTNTRKEGKKLPLFADDVIM